MRDAENISSCSRFERNVLTTFLWSMRRKSLITGYEKWGFPHDVRWNWEKETHFGSTKTRATKLISIQRKAEDPLSLNPLRIMALTWLERRTLCWLSLPGISEYLLVLTTKNNLVWCFQNLLSTPPRSFGNPIVFIYYDNLQNPPPSIPRHLFHIFRLVSFVC